MRTPWLRSAVLAVAVVAAVAVASNVTLPFSFTANTPARASEVNGNFAAVKTAVDDSQTQIDTLRNQVNGLAARACPAGMTVRADTCVENAPRAAASWQNAVTACATAGMRLCDADVMHASCSSLTAGSSEEWLRTVATDNASTISRLGSGGCIFDSVPQSSARAFRCCVSR